MNTINIEQTQDQARQLLNSRIESVTALVKTKQRVADLKEQLAEAEKDDKKAYVRATRDGWTADELKKLGLESGAATKRRQTRRVTGSTFKNEAPDNASPSGDVAPEQIDPDS